LASPPVAKRGPVPARGGCRLITGADKAPAHCAHAALTSLGGRSGALGPKQPFSSSFLRLTVLFVTTGRINAT